MKNFAMRYFKLLFLFILLLIAVSCQKKKESFFPPVQTNYIVSIQNATKTGQNYSLVTDIGHDGRNCPGCVLIEGQWVHINCQGPGNACRVSANVTLYNNGATSYAVTTDTFGLTDQAFFNMPDRSLFVGYDDKNNEMWLNIPAQLVYRDSTTMQFTFTGLYYSNAQVYENE